MNESNGVISTHALTEGDCDMLRNSLFRHDFNSRPHGGRLAPLWIIVWLIHISTHALTEGDVQPHLFIRLVGNFNSRPHGGRHNLPVSHHCSLYFNSRPHGGRPSPSISQS